MTTEIQTCRETFARMIRTLTHYNEALALIEWDLRTGAPKRGVELRSETMGTLAAEVFRLSTSPEMEHCLQVLTSPEAAQQLTEIERVSVRECKKDFELNKKIPPDRHEAFVILKARSGSVWEEAKKTDNFELFRPYLEKVVDMTREFIGYWGCQGHPYNTLLDQYEPGLTVEGVDAQFDPLRKATVSLLDKIVASGRRPDTTALEGTFPVESQRKLGRFLLKEMGYDFDAGRIDETEHPFETTLNLYDVRVTTRYIEDDLRSAMFAAIHEGGHALYEQGVSPDLVGTVLCGGASMAVHESQSLFWENVIGRSRPFWDHYYGKLQDIFPQLRSVSLDAFYAAINDVHPSLIRIESDELTYSLHIILRYELEKGLVSGDLQVADLPGLWREKMKAYLGIEPPTDRQGVLQDVHWSDGSFGYFPSYALGKLYSAQFTRTLAEQMPNMWDQVRAGELHHIRDWLRENIHRYGKLETPKEIITRVTGEPLSPKAFIHYLEAKFTPLYGL